MTVIDLDEFRAAQPPVEDRAQAGESAPPDFPADHYENVEQALQSARTAIDYLYSGTWDESFLQAVADNRGFIGPLIYQLLEINRQCEKVKAD